MFTFEIVQQHLKPRVHRYGGDFIVLLLEVLLILRNKLVTRLSSEESAFVLRLYCICACVGRI